MSKKHREFCMRISINRYDDEVMCSSLSEAINNISKRENKIYTKKYKYNNFMINSAYFGIINKEIKLGVHLPIDKINKEVIVVSPNTNIKDQEYTTFFDTVGLTKEYMHIFDILRNETQLSKQEIATKLRYELICRLKSKKYYIFTMGFPCEKL